MAFSSVVHLNVHSDFSFTRGASKVGDLAKRAKKLGMPAMALTDTENMHGAFEFSKKASGEGVQPIIGIELRLSYGDGKSGTVVLLAQTERGYVNLCTMMSAALRPREDGRAETSVPPKTLMECADDVIALSGGDDGILRAMISDGMVAEAREMAGFLQGVFGDRFYVQINRCDTRLTRAEREIEDILLDLAYDTAFGADREDGGRIEGIPLVATSSVYYASEDRHDAWEILHAVETKQALMAGEDGLAHKERRRFHLRSAEEMAELFADLPEALANTVEIARRCSFMVKGRNPILPAFPTEGGRSEAEELRHQARVGLEARLQKNGIDDNQAPLYRERLERELDVIEGMGFPGYFLIVSDFIKWAKAQGIPVGPGRGSGAGSLVAYSLTITDLDPFRYGLLFERFLNPERVSMPDFDIDFCQDRRGEVIRYVQEKYGVDQVAQIANFGEIKSKTAIKDAARVIIHEREGGFGFSEVNDLTKMIPKKEDSADPKSLADALKSTPELQQKTKDSAKLGLLYDNALKIEGLYRSQGLHAAGIVIADRPLHELVPLGWDRDTGLPVCQFNMKSAEPCGLVKFDFLGLKTLSVIKYALALIREFRGIDLDIDHIPEDDPAVFAMLSDGKANGIFQFESAGMQKWLRQIKPTRIEDLIALNALYRPGPMDMIPHYAACKNGDAQPEYPEPINRTKPFLEETFGILVYQEQVMQVAQVVAGYSLGGADLLRRAMGKKIKEEMDKERAKFVKGAVENGTPREKANELFDHIAKFAGYGFNKSHAAAYAWIAYQTAYLKCHFPVEFFSALLTYEIGHQKGPERMALIKDDMDEWGIPLLPPCINRSYPRFRPEACENGYKGYGIRFALNAVKGVSGDLPIMLEARRTGPFKSLADFSKRAGAQFNKGQLERLAEAGAFDVLSPKRYAALNILTWLAKHEKAQAAKGTAQGDLFGAAIEVTVPRDVAEIEEWGDLVDREFRAVGFFFSKHPLDPYVPRLKKANVKRKMSLHAYMRETDVAELSRRRVCVIVEEVKLKESMKGTKYLLIRVAEKQEVYFVTFFNSKEFPLDRARSILDAAKAGRKPVVLVVDLTLEDEGESVRVFGREVHDVDVYLADIRGSFTVVLSDRAVRLNLAEQARIEAKEDAGAVRLDAVRRKIRELREYFEGIRADNDPTAVELTVRVEADGLPPEAKRVAGRFRITPAVENHLKTIDGIVSVAEAA